MQLPIRRTGKLQCITFFCSLFRYNLMDMQCLSEYVFFKCFSSDMLAVIAGFVSCKSMSKKTAGHKKPLNCLTVLHLELNSIHSFIEVN